MTYEQMAIAEALRHSTLTLTPEEEERVAETVVVALHEQHFRLISDDFSFDD